MTLSTFFQANFIKATLTLILAALLSACGGGSDGGDTTTGGSTNTGTNSATIRWTPPSTNEDGSGLNDLAGYKVRYGASQGSYPNIVVVSNNVTETTIDNLSTGTYYFVVTAHDNFGNDSAFSDPPVSKTVN